MIYFTDFFGVDESVLDQYGAFNISLINDLPLFIDPFLLFGNSENEKYKNEHSKIIKYLSFLKKKSDLGYNTDSNIQSWYKFSEVKQNWFGYSLVGNGGSGLGMKFGKAMSSSMSIVYDDIESETITQTTHLEKAGLFQLGVGKDNISDFTTNLIKEFLCEYTEEFAKTYLKSNQTKKITVRKVFFDYTLERWMPKSFVLPFINGDYVILTPKELLTKDDNWINSNDLKGNFEEICSSISNEQLRSEISNYFSSKLPAPTREKKTTQAERNSAINAVIQKYPEILKYYIKSKEENKVGAKNISKQKVKQIEEIFIGHVSNLLKILQDSTDFYSAPVPNSFDEAMKRVLFLKDVIENKDGYRLFYVNGNPIKRESDLQIIYRLTWFASPMDVNREVNNGRGPADYKVSHGAKNSSLIEFKLASNSKLKMNLENQVKIYEKASNTKKSIKVIMFFDLVEKNNTEKILRELKLDKDESIILIDAIGNKPSASNVKN